MEQGKAREAVHAAIGAARREAERAAERVREADAREAEREAARVAREAERVAREAQREAARVAREAEREAERAAKRARRSESLTYDLNKGRLVAIRQVGAKWETAWTLAEDLLVWLRTADGCAAGGRRAVLGLAEMAQFSTQSRPDLDEFLRRRGC
eukprot:COSAG02_NODE_4839_length_4919_cov_149.355187_5_plen_156_part_00